MDEKIETISVNSATNTLSSRDLQINELCAEISCYQEQIKALEKKQREFIREIEELVLLVLDTKKKLNEIIYDYKHQK